MKNRYLQKDFFNRKTLVVAKDLLGCYLCIRRDGKIERYAVTETEAYIGPHDLACHSSRGKTPRNSPMFEEAGTIYVYFTYGMHFMLNIVTEEKDYPSAVLIRGLEGIVGPGRLTKALGIDKRFNGKVANKKTGLWFEEAKEKISSRKIKRTPRIGIDYAGPVWTNKKYRFVLEASELIRF